MSLFEELEHAQALLDQAYVKLVEAQKHDAEVGTLQELHAATEEALTEARALVQALERLAEQQKS